MQEEKLNRTKVRGGGVLNNNSSKRRWILGITLIASITLIIGALSYAYFSIGTSDNKNQEIVLTSGTMQLRFADNDNGINAKLNFGESVTKLFIIENTGTLTSFAKISFTNIINTYLKGSLTYKLEMATTEDSTIWKEVQGSKNVPISSTASTKTLANYLEIPVGTTYYYRLTITLEDLPKTDQTKDINAIFTTTFGIAEASEEPSPSDIVLANLGITANPPQESIPNFAIAAKTDEGVYALEDNYGTSYYYRGASLNNYVKYGQDKDGNDMYWRIVRINGDGSLRIIYDGTQAYANGSNNASRYAILAQPWNAQYADAKYVGWMFGGVQGEASTSKEQAQRNETNSDAKTATDRWYKENIVDTGYGDNIADVIFCNDRSIPGRAASGWSEDTGLGYAKNTTAYGAYSRFYHGGSGIEYENPKPTFICNIKNDAFTVNESEIGNGALTYPVGLITADEIVAAGSGKYGTANNSYYLYKSSSYFGWSFSPGIMHINGYAYSFNVDISGFLNNHPINYTNFAIAPVINLSEEFVSTLVGDGSMTNPYRSPDVTT